MRKGKFEILSREHDRERFDCGVAELNSILRQHARRQRDSGVSRSIVLVDEDATKPKPVLGFFTLVAAQPDSELLSPAQAKKLPNTAPCVLLARLAVSKKAQGRGLGRVLLTEAIMRTLQVAGEIGVAGFFVEAKDEEAAAFNEKFGFFPFPSNGLKLFQTLKALKP